MAPKSQSKKSETPAPVTPVVEAAPVAAPQKVSKKTKKEEAAPAPVVEATPAVESTEQSSERKERRNVTKETLHTDFEALLTKINSEVDRLRESKPKAKGSKFLKTLNKDIKQLHNDVLRVTKFKRNGDRKTSSSSGFLKPVNISAELAKFTSWDANKAYSRTQVTKFICEYIKNKELYDKNDKRNIICDAALKNLLKYDPSNPPKDEKGKVIPLTYFRLQQYLKSHFKTAARVSVEDDLE